MKLAAVAVTGALLLGACSSVADSAEQAREAVDPAPARPSYEKYVALGDSFTAAPLVPTTDLADGCLRSDGNYPSIVAAELDVAELVDVSCSGADTADLRGPQRTVGDTRVPPQLRAVDEDTDLVTLGIGGNDFDLFATLVQTCSSPDAQQSGAAPCATTLEDRGVDLVALTERIGKRVATAVEQVRRRAPQAEVLLVGYPRIAPESGGCRALPFADGDSAFGAKVSRALNSALEQAARRTGAGFVDMYAASKGHDVCSDDAWVNGRRTIRGEALAYHPFAEGMEAVADEVVAALSE